MAGVIEGKVWEVRYYVAGTVTPTTPTPSNIEKRVYVAAKDIPTAIEKFNVSSFVDSNMFKYLYSIALYQHGVIF